MSATCTFMRKRLSLRGDDGLLRVRMALRAFTRDLCCLRLLVWDFVALLICLARAEMEMLLVLFAPRRRRITVR